jgi:hypothetical protein
MEPVNAAYFPAITNLSTPPLRRPTQRCRRWRSAAEAEAEKMWCQSCKEEYEEDDAGTCKECYEEASETEEELKREIDDLRSRLLFLRLPSPTLDAAATGHADILLHASYGGRSGSSDSDAGRLDTPAVPAHRVILVSFSFRAFRLSSLDTELNPKGSWFLYAIFKCEIWMSSPIASLNPN